MYFNNIIPSEQLIIDLKLFVYLGNYFWKVKKDNQTAIDYYQRGIKQGCTDCMTNLALLYCNTSQEDLSVKLFEQAANEDNTTAMLHLSTHYHFRNDDSRSVEYAAKAIESGDVRGYYMLGLSLKNDELMEYYCLKVVETDNSFATLARKFLVNRFIAKKDFSLAKKHLLELVDSGQKLDNGMIKAFNRVIDPERDFALAYKYRDLLFPSCRRRVGEQLKCYLVQEKSPVIELNNFMRDFRVMVSSTDRPELGSLIESVCHIVYLNL